MRKRSSFSNLFSWFHGALARKRIASSGASVLGGRIGASRKWIARLVACALFFGSASLFATWHQPSAVSAISNATLSKEENTRVDLSKPAPSREKAGNAAETSKAKEKESEKGKESPKKANESNKSAGEKVTDAAPQEAATTQANPVTPEEDEQEGAEFLRKRAEWFYRQRAYPLKRIPPGMREKALQHLDRMIESQRAQSFSVNGPAAAVPAAITFPGPSTWTQIGPQPAVSPQFGNVSGRINAIAPDLKNASIVFLGSAEGGVWSTTNGGITWTPMTDQAPSLAISSLAIDPNSCSGANCTVIYAGTGEENFNIDAYAGAGILKSTNGGTSWGLVCSTVGPSCPFVGGPLGSQTGGTKVGAIAVQPGNGLVVLAAMTIVDGGTGGGIFRSTDSGATWSQVISGAAGTDVVFESTSNGGLTATAYAAMGDAFGDTANGIYKSTNSGQTWTKMTGTGLPTTNVGRIQLGYAPSTAVGTAVVYASIGDSSTSSSKLNGLFKSSAGAGTSGAWTKLTVTGTGVVGGDYCTGQCFYDMPIRVDPATANNVFVGGSAFNSNHTSLFRSLDGGTTWGDVTATGGGFFLHPDHHALAFTPVGLAPATLYDGNDGGIWSSTNFTTATASSVTWSDLNASLAITQFYPGLAINPSNENDSFGGTQDNGTEQFSGGLAWSVNACGDGGAAAYDRNVPTNVYVNCTILNPPYIRKSVFGGAAGTFFPAAIGIDPADAARTPFIPQIGIDRNNPSTLYTGTYRVYQSTDGASTWTPISPDLSADGTSGIVTGAIAQSNSPVVYAGTQDGQIWRTTNAAAGTGAIWTNLTKAPLPGRSITSISVDGSDPNTAFVAFSGFSGFADAAGHIFKTTDGGSTWADVSCHVGNCGTPGVNDLANIPVNFVAFDESSNTIFAGTDTGVFNSSDGGTTWTPLGTGLPRVAVLGADAGRRSTIIHLATHGRSVWTLQLPGSIPSGPLFTSMTPAFAAVGAGAAITVDGANFLSGTSIVQWDGATNGIIASFVSGNQLTATIPAGLMASAGTHSVTVFDATQTPNTSKQLIFVVLGTPPSVTSISPTTGPANTAIAPLTVTGSGAPPFVSGASVIFNGHAVAAGTVTPTTLTALIPAALVNFDGTVPVTAANPGPGGGPSPGVQPFLIVTPAPTITTLTPATINAGGPNFNLLVTGTNFMTNSVVNVVGSTRPTNYVSPTQLRAQVLASDIAGAGLVPITVVNPVSGTSAPVNLTVGSGSNLAPTITSLVPPSVAAASNFALTVNGTSYVGSSVVNVAGVPRPTTFVSATQLTASVSSSEVATPGIVAITVFNPAPGGGTSGASNLTVNNGAPTITSLAPGNTAPAGTPGGPLTVNGTNFGGNSTVNFNGSARATSLVTSTQVIATILTSDLATPGAFPVTVTNSGTGGSTSGPVTFTVTGGAACTINFTAASGTWQTAANWTPNAVPGAADTACIASPKTVTISAVIPAITALNAATGSSLTISSGNLTFSGASAAGNLIVSGGTLTANAGLNVSGAATLSAGTITGTGTITTPGLFTWTGGTLVGTASPNAVFNANGGVDFNGGVANGSSHQLNQRSHADDGSGRRAEQHPGLYQLRRGGQFSAERRDDTEAGGQHRELAVQRASEPERHGASGSSLRDHGGQWHGHEHGGNVPGYLARDHALCEQLHERCHDHLYRERCGGELHF
jgi:hypothetical protein